MKDINTAVVLKFIKAMSSADAALADTCVGQGAFTIAKGFGKFSGRRERDTMVGTIDAFRQLLPAGLGVEIRSVTAQEDRVVVEFEGNAITCDDKPYNNQYCMVFFMQDGKIHQVNEYFCNIHADEVLWPLVSGLAEQIP